MQNELLPRFTKTPAFEPVAMFLAVNELDFLGGGGGGSVSESVSGRSRSGGSLMDRESSLRETANMGGTFRSHFHRSLTYMITNKFLCKILEESVALTRYLG